MPLKSELMASGMSAAEASKLGLDPVAAFTAAGTTQATATVLSGNVANVTTSAIGAGVMVGFSREKNVVFNAGPNVLTIYPPVGSTILGQAVNVGIQLAPSQTAILEGDGTTLVALVNN